MHSTQILVLILHFDMVVLLEKIAEFFKTNMIIAILIKHVQKYVLNETSG